MTLCIGLHATGLLGQRTHRTLTAEPDLTVDRLGADPLPATPPWDALAIEALNPVTRPAFEKAVANNIPVVIADQLPPSASPLPPESTLVSGVLAGENLAAALAPLLTWEDNPARISLAWTVPGPPLGAGTAVTFPDPVGPLWAGRAQGSSWPDPAVYLTAPTDQKWGAVSIRIEPAGGGTPQTVALADDTEFLRSIFFSAAVLTAARGYYPPGINLPGDSAGNFLAAARKAGLEIASFVPAS